MNNKMKYTVDGLVWMNTFHYQNTIWLVGNTWGIYVRFPWWILGY